MENFNHLLHSAASCNSRFLFELMLKLIAVSEDSAALGQAVIEVLQSEGIQDKAMPPEGMTDKQALASHALAYRALGDLIKQHKEDAAIEVLRAFEFDPFLSYAKTHVYGNPASIIGLALKHGCRKVSMQLFMAGAIDLSIKGFQRDFARCINDLYAELQKQYARSVTSYKNFANDARSLAVNTAKFLNEVEFALLDEEVHAVVIKCASAFAEDIEALMYIKRLRLDLTTLYSQKSLIRACENTLLRVIYFKSEMAHLSDMLKQRHTKRTTREILRKDIKNLRQQKKLESDIWSFISESGADDGWHLYWQAGLKNAITTGQGVRLQDNIDIMKRLRAALGATIVPGSKASPAANLVWFFDQFNKDTMQKSLDIGDIVPYIRTEEQLKVVTQCFDISPPMILMLYGETMKPAAKKLCVHRLGESA